MNSTENSQNSLNPLVSIIIPVYNVEKYLSVCMESVINQTYHNLEIVCVDDCSQDNSLKIIEAFAAKDKRISIIRHNKNLGLSASRNSALEMVLSSDKDGFIIFVDSDDSIDLSLVEKCVAAFNDNIDAVCYYINPVLDNIDECYMPPKHYFDISYSGEHEINSELISNVKEMVQIKAFRKKIVAENNLRFPRGLIHEDVAFHLMYMYSLTNKLFFIPERLYNYTIRNNSLSTNSIKNKLIFHRIANLYYTRRYFEKNNKLNVLFNKQFIRLTENLFLMEFGFCKTTEEKNKLFSLTSKILKDFPSFLLIRDSKNLFITLLLKYNLFYVYLLMYKINWQIIKIKSLFTDC